MNTCDGIEQVIGGLVLDQSRVIQPHGGYRDLKAFQMAEIVYDGTIKFCERFIDKRSRTTDQMVQAARSGRQNIAEGSMASATSSRTELKLVGVARASLEELLLDYEDFLRQRGIAQWEKSDLRAIEIRRIGTSEDRSYESYKTYIEAADAEVAANALICLVHQTNYLLDQVLRQLEERFVNEGGFSERLFRARWSKRP